MLKTFVQYRYFFLLSSIFAIFCGFMYNEFFAIPLNLFGTCYTEKKNGELILSKKNGDDNWDQNCVYPVGLDPSWIGTVNELTYTNSLKMKLSIIVGVLHMMLGIFIRGVNNFNANNRTAFFFEFIPQFLFMGIMFGYLIGMIYYKWGTNYDINTAEAPSLLSIMINMAIKLGEIDGKPLFESFLGFSQENLNRLILGICIILIPIMLFVRPIQFYLRKVKTKGISFRNDGLSLIQNENKSDDNLNINNDNENNSEINENNSEDNHSNNSGDYSLSLSQESAIKQDELYSQLYAAQKKKYKEEAKSKYQFVELFIGQLIDVIEYVLGTVSNTASYLRLWALSLAHTALSHVFIEKTFIAYIQNDQVNIVSSVIGVFMYFLVFLFATGFILIFMDAMECVLHTLRLHWVEFQNKFYKGDGYLFQPFSFKTLFKSDEILKE